MNPTTGTIGEIFDGIVLTAGGELYRPHESIKNILIVKNNNG